MTGEHVARASLAPSFSCLQPRFTSTKVASRWLLRLLIGNHPKVFYMGWFVALEIINVHCLAEKNVWFFNDLLSIGWLKAVPAWSAVAWGPDSLRQWKFAVGAKRFQWAEWRDTALVFCRKTCWLCSQRAIAVENPAPIGIVTGTLCNIYESMSDLWVFINLSTAWISESTHRLKYTPTLPWKARKNCIYHADCPCPSSMFQQQQQTIQ